MSCPNCKCADCAIALHGVLACGCRETCGDDGDIDGPGTCKGLPMEPLPPLVEIVLMRRDAAHFEGSQP